MKITDLKNDVKIVGELVSKEVRRNKVGTVDEQISMDLTVRVSPEEEHVVSFFAFKYGKNKDGNREINKDKLSKLFTGYETVDKEFKTMSDENGDGTGELVDIKGSLAKNMYVGKDGELKEFVKIKGTFCSRVKDVAKYKPCAVWVAHMHITKMDEEVVDKTGEYTKIMGMLANNYSEDEFEFRIYSSKTRTGFSKVFDKGDSAKLEGRIVNRPDEAVVVVEDEEDGWGEDLEASADSGSTIRRRYLEIVRGDTRPMDTDDEEHPLNEEKIKEYKKNITKRKSDVIARHEEKQKEEGNTKKLDPNKGVGAEDEEIPF